MSQQLPRQAGDVRSGLKPIEQEALFSDILCMWMGPERTQFLTFNEQTLSYECLQGTVRQRNIVLELQECGSLARQIDLSLTAESESSFLQQSLRGALRRQLTNYHFFVSSLRERGGDVALGDLVVAHKKAVSKLRAMFAVLVETERAKGGELASKMQELQHQCSQRLSELLNEIYVEAVGPLLKMTVEWITKGEASDPFDECFITVDHKVDDASDAMWTTKYGLAADMIPSTVTRTVAEQVLLVAKNISFIRKCCRAKDWRMDPTITAAAQQTSFGALPQLVSAALKFTNQSVIRLLREKFKLEDALSVVQSFLLIGNSEFYELLIPRLDPLLSKISTHVQTAVVRDHVQSTLLEVTGGSRQLDNDLAHLLFADIVKDDKAIGWDAFTLMLPVPSPLNNIFDQTAMKVYRRLFKVLFRVKRAEVALKLSWRQSVVLDRAMVRVPQNHETEVWKKVAGDAHLLGLQLMHFVNNLWSYLVSEVNTSAWDRLKRSLRRCDTIDDIREAHNAFLQELSLCSLLHTDCYSMRQNIESILLMVPRYSAVQLRLCALVERGHGNVLAISADFSRIADEFSAEMSSLLTGLEELHLQFDFLNFLLLRLNFNQFYHDATVAAANTEF
jgi:gamma-tubulin complex component 3